MCDAYTGLDAGSFEEAGTFVYIRLTPEQYTRAVEAIASVAL